MDIKPDPRCNVDLLVPILYNDLRRMARRARWQVGAGATLQTTALVNEAYLKLRRSEGFNDSVHFMRTAAIAMRQILINLARAATAAKRGDGALQVPLDDLPEMAVEDGTALLEIHAALERLVALNPRLAQVVECRFFGGMSEEEIAQLLNVTVRTVQRDWVKARMLLRRALFV